MDDSINSSEEIVDSLGNSIDAIDGKSLDNDVHENSTIQDFDYRRYFYHYLAGDNDETERTRDINISILEMVRKFGGFKIIQ